MTALTLLGDVRWRGAPVASERSRALLAALAAAGGRPVRAERLIDLVWGEEAPADAAKGLQVLVSRTRTALGADAIVRDAVGYRLGVDPAEVDSVRLSALARDAAAALDDDADRAATLAREALALANGLPAPVDAEADPLAELRRAAAGDLATARVVLARASSRTGAHAQALTALEAAHAERPDDEALLADLLRSEAAVRGPGAALERYEAYRQGLLDRLGTNPGERLRRAHRDLLALDRPVRAGVRYDASSLRGRDRDVARLRSLLTDARVVSIIGPGGLGKTRLAHVLARDAAEPVVHVVELVGVTTAEDVVGEVGSVLGVRDSVSAQRTLTPEQRLDVRSRIAQRLAQGPGLLVLDNCEHVIDAAAELVAFLVSATADLRVLTTSRAPLEIGAEHVYLLGELEPADAAALFCDRALAARPDAELPEEIVRSIVTRLDGLPLAIELAAAKVRAMSVDEISRRLADRFALLRGGDRAAPDRHQTLLAVIDWSWNLLDEPERRALRRLALFNDGFTLEAADAVLGDGALDAVQGLVDQSLLSIRDAAGGLRYRMLETVREFGRLQLEQAGEGDEARAARRAWAIAYAGRPPRRPVQPRPVRDDRRARRRGDQPRRRTARRARRRRPRRARRAARRARDLLDDPRRARPPDRHDGRDRRRGSRLAAAAGARGHHAGRADDRDGERDGHGGPAQRAAPRAAGAPGAGRRRARGSPGWSRCCSSTTRRIPPRSRPVSSSSPAIPTATSRCPRSSGSATCARTWASPRLPSRRSRPRWRSSAATRGHGSRRSSAPTSPT